MQETNYPRAVLDKAKSIKILALDMDGIMTNGAMVIDENGIRSRYFNALDGYGIQLVREFGIQTAIITASPNEKIVKTRAEELAMDHVLMRRFDKYEAMLELSTQLGIPLSDFAYMGDDLPDIKAIHHAGLGISVPNAHYLVRQYSDYVTENSSSDGAVREVCDLLLIAQDKMQSIFDRVLPLSKPIL